MSFEETVNRIFEKMGSGEHEEKDDVYDCAQNVMQEGHDEDSAYAICQDSLGKESNTQLPQIFQNFASKDQEKNRNMKAIIPIKHGR